MKLRLIFILCVLGLLFASLLRAQTNWPPLPPQDQGLPYTRSAQTFALAKVADTVAVFAGSRYAWVHGFKVRLDDANWRDESVLLEGKVFVPATFVGVLDLSEVKPAAAPSYLADRWVYSLALPITKAPTIMTAARAFPISRHHILIDSSAYCPLY